ncbi:MAG: trypsin-like serine protease [Iphinoe sp. HA4291-MV1]|nr:trypsin-like serine protease [Iphinoe sp. HA4291-MV1]
MTILKHPSLAVFAAILTTLGTAQLARAIVTTNDPELHRVGTGDFSGVALITSVTDDIKSSCTGSLLKGGSHILTAAHCLTDTNGQFQTNYVNTTQATFNLPTGSVSIPVVDFFVHPEYDGVYYKGNDIAVLRLETPAPSEAEQYDIYRDEDEVGQVFTQVGYGYTGTGSTGYDSQSSLDTAYFGQNQFDALVDVFDSVYRQEFKDFPGVVLGSQLFFDFDNAQAENDAFGVHFNINDLGLGVSESNSAPGDSGAPAFIDNLIAGITSYSLSGSGISANAISTDIDTQNNSSFGEFSSRTRISHYAQFIDDAIAGKISAVAAQPQSVTKRARMKSLNIKRQQSLKETPKTVPESTSILGMLAFGACCLLSQKKVKSRWCKVTVK